MTIGVTLKEVATTIQPNVAYSLGSLFTTEATTDIVGATGIDFSSTSNQGWVFSAILGGIAYPADFVIAHPTAGMATSGRLADSTNRMVS